MKILTQKKWDALEQQMKAMQSNNMASLVNNFNLRIFPNFSVVKEMDAYQTMDQIYCVVRKLATCSALIPFYGYNAEEEDLPENDPLVLFLESLDFEQKEMLYTYLYLNGEVFIYKSRYELGVNGDMLSGVSFLHPSRVSLGITSDFPRQVRGYFYFDVDTGENKPVNLEDIIHIKLPNPSSNVMDEFRGLSPIKVLARTLTRIHAGEDATVAQLQNGGVPGIVYNKMPGASVETTGQRKDAFGRFLRNSENKGAPYFAGDELGYISLGTPLTDMEVTALAGIDFDRICNAYGVSSVLFNNKSASTESNVQEMLKEMYTNTIIPNVHRVEGALNKGLLNIATPDIKTKGHIKCDVSEIKALQDDQAKLVTALAAAWWLTPNEKREAQMYDVDTEDELMDKYLVPSNLVPIDDLIMPEPIDNTAGDYVAPADANKNPKVVPLKTGTNG